MVLALVNCKVPPLITIEPVVPRAPAEPNESVPPAKVVEAVYELVPVKVKVPDPDLVSEPPLLLKSLAKLTFWPLVSSL